MAEVVRNPYCSKPGIPFSFPQLFCTSRYFFKENCPMIWFQRTANNFSKDRFPVHANVSSLRLRNISSILRNSNLGESVGIFIYLLLLSTLSFIYFFQILSPSFSQTLLLYSLSVGTFCITIKFYLYQLPIQFYLYH